MKRFNIVFLSIIILSLLTCSKDKDNEEIEFSTDTDTVMIELFTEISPENETFMDIAPIPIPPELYDYAEIDTNFQRVIQFYEDFNDMIENPGFLLETSSLKSGEALHWKSLGCEEFPLEHKSICKRERDHGEYKFTAIQTFDHLTGSKFLETFIRGVYYGFDYDEWGGYKDDDEGYRIHDWLVTNHDTTTIINTYYTPFNDIIANKPKSTSTYTVGEGYTIYTPWGGEDYIRHVMYIDIIYSYDYINGHHESMQSFSEWLGDLLTTISSSWCLLESEMRIKYISYYDFDTHAGNWCSFDCDEVVIDCGSN